MALYQYYLAVVPGEGVMKRYDTKPDSIRVSTDTGHFKSDAESYWKEVEIKVEDILPKIDRLVIREKWGNGKMSFYWKTKTDNVDNDVAIYLDEKTLTISEFSFRADLREKDLFFLMNMIELGKEYDWMFMDRNGKLMNADFEEIKISIQESGAYRFMQDPIIFFKNLIDKNE